MVQNDTPNSELRGALLRSPVLQTAVPSQVPLSHALSGYRVSRQLRSEITAHPGDFGRFAVGCEVEGEVYFLTSASDLYRAGLPDETRLDRAFLLLAESELDTLNLGEELTSA